MPEANSDSIHIKKSLKVRFVGIITVLMEVWTIPEWQHRPSDI